MAVVLKLNACKEHPPYLIKVNKFLGHAPERLINGSSRGLESTILTSSPGGWVTVAYWL